MVYQLVHEDAVDQNAYMSELEGENETLRRKLQDVEHELQCRSPTHSPRKPKVLSLNLGENRMAAGSGGGNEALGSALSKFNGLRMIDPTLKAGTNSPGKTPIKKIRKLTARKWDLMAENEMEAFENY